MEELEGLYGLEPGGFSGAIAMAGRRASGASSRRRSVRHAAQHVVDLDHEFRIVRPDGAVRWIASRAGLLRRSGAIARLLGGIDITDRKQAELRDRLLVELAPAFVSRSTKKRCLCSVGGDRAARPITATRRRRRRGFTPTGITHAQPAAQELLQ